MTAEEIRKDILNDTMPNKMDWHNFLCHKREHPKNTCTLVKEVQDVVSKSGMSVSAAKGFFDYMKIVVEERSYISPPEECLEFIQEDCQRILAYGCNRMWIWTKRDYSIVYKVLSWVALLFVIGLVVAILIHKFL